MWHLNTYFKQSSYWFEAPRTDSNQHVCRKHVAPVNITRAVKHILSFYFHGNAAKMSKIERMTVRVEKLLTKAVQEVLEAVRETVSEYQEKTARTQRENQSLKRKLQELQDRLKIDNNGKITCLLSKTVEMHECFILSLCLLLYISNPNVQKSCLQVPLSSSKPMQSKISWSGKRKKRWRRILL